MEKRDEKRVEKVNHDGVMYERHSAVKGGNLKVWWEISEEYGPVDPKESVKLEAVYNEAYGIKKERKLGVDDLSAGYYVVCARCSKMEVSAGKDGVSFIHTLNSEGWRVIEGSVVCNICQMSLAPPSQDAQTVTENKEEEIIIVDEASTSPLAATDIPVSVVGGSEIYSLKCDGCDLEIDATSPEALESEIKKHGIMRVREYMLCQTCRRKNKVARTRRGIQRRI